MWNFIGWLEERPSWPLYFKMIGYMLAFEVVWTAIVAAVMHYGGIPEPKLDPEFEKMIQSLMSLPLAASGLVFLAVAFFEEFIFRLVPLFLAMLLFRWSSVTRPLIVVVLFLSAVAFALVHMGNFDTATTSTTTLLGVLALVILNQGLGGFLWGTFFLKYCGLHFKYATGAFFTLVLLHATWDTGLIAFSKAFE